MGKAEVRPGCDVVGEGEVGFEKIAVGGCDGAIERAVGVGRPHEEKGVDSAFEGEQVQLEFEPRLRAVRWSHVTLPGGW